MHSVMTNNISQHIKNILTKENSNIRKYISEQVILDFIEGYKNVKNDDEFKKYIIDIYESNIKYFFNIDNSDKNNKIQKSFLISRECDNFIKCCKAKTCQQNFWINRQ